MVYFFRIGLFYMHHPADMLAHTMAFVISVLEHWLEREIAQWVPHEGSVRILLTYHQIVIYSSCLQTVVAVGYKQIMIHNIKYKY